MKIDQDKDRTFKPIHFDLTLRFRHRCEAQSVLVWLASQNIDYSFSYDMEMKEKHEEYVIEIYDMSWSLNLYRLAAELKELEDHKE